MPAQSERANQLATGRQRGGQLLSELADKPFFFGLERPQDVWQGSVQVLGVLSGRGFGGLFADRFFTEIILPRAAVDAVWHRQVMVGGADPPAGELIFQLALRHGIFAAAPAEVVQLGEIGKLAGQRLAGADRPDGDAFAGMRLLPKQPAAGKNGVIEVRRKVNPVHSPFLP